MLNRKVPRRSSRPSTLDLEADLSVTWVRTDSLRPNPRNARTHNRHHIRELAASLKKFKWTKPIIADDTGMVIAGHGCLQAAKQLGLETVPVIRRGDLSKEQIRLYALADNKLAEKSGWDTELLAIELKELEDLGADLSVTGFEFGEIEGLLDDFYPRNEVEDELHTTLRDLPPVARPGDLFQLGRHRLLCGDATGANDVRRVLDGAEPVLMVTDPPYGVDYEPAWRNRLGVSSSKRSRGIRNDDRADWQEAWALFPGDVAYVWHSAVHANAFHKSLLASGFEIRVQIVWVKNRFPIGRGDYHWAHEPAFYAVRKGRSANWCGNRKQTTVWQISAVTSGQDSDTEHPTQKPVECMKRPILNNSRVGQGVYDPFLGSGTTLVAAERTGRIAYGLEIDPHFVDTAVRRWQALTGKDATLAGTNETFDEIAAERRPASAADESRSGDRLQRSHPPHALEARHLRVSKSLRRGRR